MGKERAITSLRLASSVTRRSAAGQSLHPWLVKSSTTTGRCACCPAHAPVMTAAAKTTPRETERMRMGQNHRLNAQFAQEVRESRWVDQSPAEWPREGGIAPDQGQVSPSG